MSGPLSKPEISKKLEKSVKPDKNDAALAGNMDLVITAHRMLTELGYENIEIMDLLSTAHFLAGGGPVE